ncbi:unnamed protein product [Owenia fusiformis]|uniref:Methylosome protein 50 n=1 Tax=Owenia fusiformis TaxID=6347 RepID=A0A8S4Q3A3_OWEFU|nr:unnamed protein product [Owenia fusiformis]
MSRTPAVIDRHLEALDFNSDGGLLLGAGTLTGQYWYGSLWYFSDPEDAPYKEKCTAGIQVESGVTDVKWLTGTTLAHSSDTANLDIWGLTTDETEGTLFTPVSQLCGHDDIVTSLDVFSGGANQIISSSIDKCINIWDVGESCLLKSYKGHQDHVLQVSAHPTDENLFLSCSLDGRVLLWDRRKQKAASILDISPCKGTPTCITWDPVQASMYAFGDNTGAVTYKDVRQNIGQANTSQPHTGKIHRVRFSKTNPTWLGSVSDDCTVVVSDMSSSPASILSRDANNSDFVHGLAWCPKSNKLYTCGWDFNVTSLDIAKSDIQKSQMKNKLNGAAISGESQPLENHTKDGDTAMENVLDFLSIMRDVHCIKREASLLRKQLLCNA